MSVCLNRLNAGVRIRLKTSISISALHASAMGNVDGTELRYLRKCWSSENLISGQYDTGTSNAEIQSYVNKILGIRAEKQAVRCRGRFSEPTPLQPVLRAITRGRPTPSGRPRPPPPSL